MYDGLVLLVDDQPVAAEDSMEALKKYVPQENLIYAADADEAAALMKDRPVSLVFLDIEMPGMSGFGLADYMEKQHKDVPYVFLTGHADFALESYEYEPVDFLTKPLDVVRLGRTFERLAMKKAADGAMHSMHDKVAVRAGQDYVLVEPGEILHICKEKRKIWIRLKDGREYQTTASLDELERMFSDYGFYRCHQSFLIPLREVKKVRSSKFGQTYEAVLAEDTIVPVSRSKYAGIRDELERRGTTFIKGVISK